MQKLQQNFHCWRILEKTRKKSCRDLWKEDKKNGPGVEAEEEKKIDKAISDLDEKTKTYTDQLFNENLAQEWEKWCETYPVLFPTRSLTRKMMELSLFFPKFVRDEVPGMINKILRLEQEGESIHAKMNRLETKFNMILNKSKRYWHMLKEYENKLYTM